MFLLRIIFKDCLNDPKGTTWDTCTCPAEKVFCFCHCLFGFLFYFVFLGKVKTRHSTKQTVIKAVLLTLKSF